MVKFATFFLLGVVSLAAQAVPQIQHWTTANGARVYFVEVRDLPMVDLKVVFDAGGARDGDKPGLALMTNGMLSEGAGDWDANTIAERFEGVGASFGNASARDMAILSLRSLNDKKWLNQALETFTTVLTRPTFPKQAFERERARLLVGLKQAKQSPDAIGDRAFFDALYGDHPYARMPEGDERSIAALRIADLKAYYRRYYVASNAVVALVGAISRSEAEAIAERVVKGLPRGGPAATLPRVQPLAAAKAQHIAFPSTQTHILLGQPGMRRGDEDYFALYLGNHILGGSGLVSRLSEEVREKRGLSYSTYSYFSPMRETGPYMLGLQTRADQAREALAVLRRVLEDFVAKGPTAEELESAKKNLIGGFALRIDSNKDLLEYIAMIGFYGLPLDYLDRFVGNLEKVTLAEVKDAFARRVTPDKMLLVTVGEKSE